MALGYLDDSKLYAIANAIRGKTGGSASMTVDEMPTEIGSISTGAQVEPLSVTTNGTYTAPTGYAYSPVSVNVSGGGGGGLPLLATQSLGTISTTSTSAVSTGVSVSVSDIDDYDLLVVETSADAIGNRNLLATVGFILLLPSNGVSPKNDKKVISQYWYCATTGTKTSIQIKQYTTAYGIYPLGPTISGGNITIPMYAKYSSSYTSTINGAYTTRVYGVKLYDLIGG